MALPSDLKHGTLVQILNTENVAQRFPDLVGELATVDKVPVYPSTWFTVKISQQPARTVKMQPTALKLVSNFPVVSPHEENAPVKNRPGRPRSTSIDSTSNDKRPRANSTTEVPSHAHTLTLGAEVVIRATESVLQRTPHLAGQIGYVKEVPIHPATWFKVRLSDNTVHTFRPSALRLASQPEEEMVENSPYRPLPATRGKTGSAKSTHTSSGPLPPELSLPPPAQPEDFLKPGVKVKIVSGRLHGQIATIIRVTNGWIQIETSSGEIAKRAADLELFNGNNLSGFEENVGIVETKRGRGRPARHSKPNRYYHNDGSDDTPVSKYKRLSVPSTHAMESFKEKYEDENSYHDNMATDSERKSFGYQNYDDSVISYGDTQRFAPDYDQVEEENDYEIPDAWKTLDIPFADPARKQQKLENSQKYVDTQNDIVMHRPDLKYWLGQIKGCMVDGLGNEKSRGDICPVCATEKWVGGKMCWNETCSSSPIYLFRDQRTPRTAEVTVEQTPNKSYLEESASAATDCDSIIKTTSEEEELPSISNVYSNDSTTTTQSHVTFSSSVHDDEPLPAGFKRPREDSIATTDVEGITPERSWSSEDLAMRGLSSASPLTLPPNIGNTTATTVV